MLRFFIFTLVLLTGCKKELDSAFFNSAIPVLPQKTQLNYTLTLLDSLKIVNNDSICFKPRIKSFYKDSLLYYSCGNKIATYEIKTGKINKISLPLKITGFISAIDVIGLDSIYILQTMPAKLIFIDNNIGNYKVIDLPKINFKTNNKFFNTRSAIIAYDKVNYNLDFNNLKFDRVNNQIQIGITPYDANLLEGFEKTNRIGVYDLKLNRWIKTYASPKGTYSHRKSYTYGKNTLSSKDILFEGDSTFLAYPVNHTVQLYINKKFSKNINFTSKYSKRIKKTLSLKEANKIEANKRLLSSIAYYSGIFYHKKSNLYSRVYLNEQEPFNNKGLYKSFTERDKYVVFISKNFNYVGEFKLPYNYDLILNKEDGFYIFTNNYKTRLDYKIINK